jgi:hypothetical protein
MIIDCHGHYTTAPEAHSSWREAQRAAFEAGQAPPPYPRISDDEIRESIEGSQLRLMRERGIDVTVFSPRASAMGHHVGDEAVSSRWTRVCNDLIARVVELYPDHFIGVCQLPQSPGVPIARSVVERRRCVEELGFVGCNLNPDPSGGHWTSAPLTDRSWYPLYEAMVELDVPAMVHVSAVTNPNFHATGSQVMLEAQQRDLHCGEHRQRPLRGHRHGGRGVRRCGQAPGPARGWSDGAWVVGAMGYHGGRSGERDTGARDGHRRRALTTGTALDGADGGSVSSS